MSKSIGIDLGTTNSVAAIKRVHTEVMKNSEGDLITPSCVTVQKKKRPLSRQKFVVGKNALEWMKQDPENIIVAVKRLMGRNYGDKEVRQIIDENRLRYRIKQRARGTENSIAVIIGNREFTPDEISAEILKKIRKDAEEGLGGKVEYAVITVPAYFNDKQKHATRTAAALAGLKVRRLLPEPTAAAISFGVDQVKGDEAKTILVFDFGGGTFDLSVLTISGGQFIEQGKGGDMWLGGEDIDQLISDFVLSEMAREYEIDDIRALIEEQDIKQKNLFLAELKEKVERAKIRLSMENEVYIEILGALRDKDGDSMDVDVELTRDRFDEIISPVVDSIVRLTRKILEDIHFTPDLIDNVLLVGGSSLIPCVIRAMKQEFGDGKVLVHERPMLAIAEGAAILSHRLAETYECPKCGRTVSRTATTCEGCGFDLEKFIIEEGVLDIVHSAAHDYYIYLENNKGHLLVEKNTPLPFEITRKFKLVHPEQKLVHMKFFNLVNDREESIGDLWLGIDDEKERDADDEGGIKNAEGPLHVELSLKIDESNLIEVSASMEEFPDVRLSKTLSRGSADEKLLLSLEKVISDANQGQYKTFEIMELTHRALSAIRDINSVVDQKTGKVDKGLYDQAQLKIEKARKMTSEGHNSKAMIYYARSAIADFGFILPPEKRDDILEKVKNLEDMDEKGTYDENLRALNDLDSSLDKLGGINTLMQIQKAGEYCMETDPARAPKFFNAIDDILKASGNNDGDRVKAIMEEITPEAMEIVGTHERMTGAVHKDITI